MSEADPRARPRRALLAWTGTLALVAALSLNESADPDLGFHLATGRAVLESGAIPSTNVLTYAEPDHPWVNQQWLPATAFTLAHAAAGFAGTLALRLALVVATAAFVLAAARRLGAAPEIAAGVTGLGAWAAAFRFVERPLLASNLALAAVIWACATAASEARDGRPRRALAFVAAAALSASLAVHLHAGALFSFVALGVLALSTALDRAAARLTGRQPWLAGPQARHAALALLAAGGMAVACAGATLALYHPHGLQVLAFPLRMASDAYLAEHLVEFRPPSAQALRVLAPYWSLVAMTVAVVLASWRRAPLPLLASIALGLALSLRHARFADLAWILIAPPLAALTSELPVLHARARSSAIAVAIALVAVVHRTTLAPPAIGPSPVVWPTPLFDAIESRGIVGRAFVQDGWAGPFLARFWPRERVFFHPSFEAYSDAHFRLYQSIRYGEPGWDRALDAYDVRVVLMKHTSRREREFQDGRPNLRQHLAASSGWALIAFDDLGAVFVRRDGPNAAAVLRAPSFVDPDRLAFAVRPARTRAALEHLAETGPSSARLTALLAVARADDGDRDGAEAMLDDAERMLPGNPALALARRALERLR